MNTITTTETDSEVETKQLKKFTIHWRDGGREVITGDTIEAAFTAAGYGDGALSAVDFYMPGDDDSYYFDKGVGWRRKTEITEVSYSESDWRSIAVPIRDLF